MLNTKKSASWRFFLLCLLCLCSSLSGYRVALAAPHECPTNHFDETATVKYIHDGDTVKLLDGRKIRLIGINAPEVARDGPGGKQKAEAYASQARKHLEKLLLGHNNQVRLVHGQEKTDHYQRVLAHLFTPDGTNLQAQLLSSGLANAITIPPNERFSSCYQQAEKQALCEKKGIWSNEILAVASLADSANGFHVLRGRVKNIQSSRKGLWINLEHGLSLRIAPRHQALFDLQRLQSLTGRSVIVRGWLQAKRQPKQGERFYMQIKHPSSIEEEKKVLKC